MKIKKMQNKYSVNWTSTRRFRMAAPNVSGGGGGGGAGGAGGNGGTILLVTSNLTPTTNNTLGTFNATDSITDGTTTLKLQTFANMECSGGSGGDGGTGGGTAFGVGSPGDDGTDGKTGRDGIHHVIFI